MTAIPFYGAAIHVALLYFREYPGAARQPGSFDKLFTFILGHYAEKLIPETIRSQLAETPLWRKRIVNNWIYLAGIISESSYEDVWLEPDLGKRRFLWKGREHRPPVPDILLREAMHLTFVEIKTRTPGLSKPHTKLKEQVRQSHYLLYRRLGAAYTYEAYGLIFINDDAADPAPYRHPVHLPLIPSA